MKSFTGALAIGLVVSAGLLAAGTTCAAEIKVLGSTGVRGVLTELGAQFEQATGHKLVVEYDVFAVLKRRIDAGEAFDVAILSPALVEEMARQGRLAGDSRATIGRTGMGAAVRSGAPRPDISSVGAFKATLLAAKSIGYPREGASGTHFLAVIDRLGVADEIKAKLRPFEGGGPPAQAFAAGEPELVVGGTTLFPAMPGAVTVGPLPAELQSFIVFTAATSSAPRDAQAAAALIRFLTSPAAAPVLKAKGMEPG